MLGGSGAYSRTKNGVIWCIPSVPKLVIIKQKINNFRIINQHPKCCAIFFPMINPDAHDSMKINIFTFFKGAGGAIAPQSQRNVKNGVFFTSNITYEPCTDKDSDLC